MKRLLLISAFSILAFPVLANDPNWNGDKDDETETVTPETPVTPTEPSRPTESWADRNNPKPMTQPLPCCIMEGQLVLKPTLFMSAKKALEKCNKAKANGSALIYECPGYVSPEPLK